MSAKSRFILYLFFYFNDLIKENILIEIGTTVDHKIYNSIFG